MVKRRKKKKLSVKKITRFVVIVVFITLLLIYKDNIRDKVISLKSGYKTETVSFLIDNDIYDNVKGYKYSKTLDTIINTNDYNYKYLNDYLNIEYQNDEKFFKNINSLLDLGYKGNDINTIYSKLDDDDIALVISKDYVKELTNILSLGYFKIDNLERYIDYSLKEKTNYEDTVTFVNIGLDHDYYTNIIDVTDNDDILVLTNKYYRLSSKYVPTDLVELNSKYGGCYNCKLRKEAALAFEKMAEDARKDNIYIYGGSGYRSYNYQLNLYNNYVATNGFRDAETFSARAGHSEHQTGLAMDVLNGRHDYISKGDKEYDYLLNNSYKYGYILRYPEGKEDITGYMYEEWHFRYLGVEVATEIHELGITYEEYIAKK